MNRGSCALVGTASMWLAACNSPEPPPSVSAAVSTGAPAAVDASRHEHNRYFLRKDADVSHTEPAPHEGTGQTTAYRYFDDVKDARVIFRKRAMPRGSAIGMHVLSHDEVYYVVSGTGELAVDEVTTPMGPDQAVFMHEGANVGIRQTGDADLVIIVSYPPAAAH